MEESEEEVEDDEEEEESGDDEDGEVVPTGVFKEMKGAIDGGAEEEPEDDFLEQGAAASMTRAKRRHLTRVINDVSRQAHSVAHKREKHMVSGDQDVALPDVAKAQQLFRERMQKQEEELQQKREQEDAAAAKRERKRAARQR